VSKKRISGGKRRTLARNKAPSKLGRPPKDEKLLWNLQRDLAWIGKPNATDSAFILRSGGFDRLSSHYYKRAKWDFSDLRLPTTTTLTASNLQLIWQLQNDEQFNNKYYKGIDQRTLRRRVAEVQCKIWGRKK
jgi:hypothetical protein